MNNTLKRMAIFGLIAAICIPSVGCGTNKESTKLAEYTIGELKAEFASSSNKYMFKPFYNVEQTTEFTFHFNSSVDPVKAITVHTDSKCEENSTVYQINDGYRTANGVDVVVKPYKPVLKAEARNDVSESSYWGYAPTYYLCVRYDLDSTEVKKLDEPIVIPFTVRNEISTPNVYASIDSKGVFSVKWLPVENAVSYKIYQSSKADKKYTKAELGYVSDTLKLIDTVDSSKTQYNMKYQLDKTSTPNEENLYVDSSGCIRWQNAKNGYTLYITAVDEKGNESFFSNPISDWEYSDILPYRLKSLHMGTVKELLQTVSVLSIDQETIVNYPINYYKNGEPSLYGHSCEYRYEVEGTRLTGKVNYYNEKDEFPEKVVSTYQKKSGINEEVLTPSIPDNKLVGIVDEDYNNSVIDLKTKIDYPEEAKIKLDPASLFRRADMEVGRVINDGIYLSSLDTIDTYVLDDNPEYIFKYENGVMSVTKSENYIEEDTALLAKKSSSIEPSAKIDNANYVEEQRKSTEKQVSEADKETVLCTEYPIFADTAGQKYIALCLIEQKEEISLKAFPEYQDFGTFTDDLYYVWYQNPYIMGINSGKIKYTPRLQKVTVEYNVDNETAKKQQAELYKKANEVIKSIIKDGMTEQEKIVAIWDYLEDNATYNYNAANYVAQGNTDYYKKYPNAWNSYGVLCENTGVCQSYASSFNLLARLCGLKSIMVSGTLNNGGHAWNAVKLNDTWYMIDVTNNMNSLGIPYWVCNSSTQFIASNGFALNDKFVHGKDTSEFETNNYSADWYYKNNLLARTPKELAEIWKNNKDIKLNTIIKYESDMDVNEFINQFKNEAIGMGYDAEEVNSWKYVYVDGMIVVKR